MYVNRAAKYTVHSHAFKFSGTYNNDHIVYLKKC